MNGDISMYLAYAVVTLLLWGYAALLFMERSRQKKAEPAKDL
jgi:hypothetical protein